MSTDPGLKHLLEMIRTRMYTLAPRDSRREIAKLQKEILELEQELAGIDKELEERWRIGTN